MLKCLKNSDINNITNIVNILGIFGVPGILFLISAIYELYNNRTACIIVLSKLWSNRVYIDHKENFNININIKISIFFIK